MVLSAISRPIFASIVVETSPIPPIPRRSTT
jgi:hypothetical protein